MIDMHEIVGQANVLFVTLDCLRFDIARAALAEGLTPNLAALLQPGGWEARDTPGTFTLPAHLAFFHGFLPTPRGPGPHPRLFALDFEGSLTIVPQTYVFAGAANVIDGFRGLGYRTFCVGGVGFFNKKNPLGLLLPSYFAESVWSPALGVTAPDSTAEQVRVACDWLGSVPADNRFLLFINISATHPPFAPVGQAFQPDGLKSQAGKPDLQKSQAGKPDLQKSQAGKPDLQKSQAGKPDLQKSQAGKPDLPPDSSAVRLESLTYAQQAALAYVDAQLPPLFRALRGRGPVSVFFMADHGEAHGEDGLWGHRLAHPTVTTVPYAHFCL